MPWRRPGQLLLAEKGTYLAVAFLAIARFGFLRWFSGLVKKGLRGAVQVADPVPVAQVRGDARQAEDGGGDARPVPVPAADPQAFFNVTAQALSRLYQEFRPAPVSQPSRVELCQAPHWPTEVLSQKAVSWWPPMSRLRSWPGEPAVNVACTASPAV